MIFGNNGCGKSGYTRLLKKAFYSKTPEDIQPNIYKPDATKDVKADFSFTSAAVEYTLPFPAQSKDIDFRQFAVFDGKSILKHLENRNQFEFRPSGLSFFGAFTDCIKRLEILLITDIGKKQTENSFPTIFDGDSEIKLLITNLSAKTDITVLRKYTPYSDDDKAKKNGVQKEYDELLLASRSKEKESATLAKLRQQLETNKAIITNNNRFFSEDQIKQLSQVIANCIEKETIAQNEGLTNFATNSIQNIGTIEWKDFILSAEKFATQQGDTYPAEGDNCIFCHQQLAPEAKSLIEKYWVFIKSVSEKEAKNAQQVIEKGIAAFEKLNFNLFPEDSNLTIWLAESQPLALKKFNEDLATHSELSVSIIKSLREKSLNDKIIALQVSTAEYDILIAATDDKIKVLAENAEAKKLADLKKLLDFYLHKEKLNLHFANIEKYIGDLIWTAKANKMSWPKRNVTDNEKVLSAKYFNQSYIDTFNEECKRLNGNFGIIINTTGSAGTSYKQLTIEGRNPATILSEGEQNVIGLSDFLSEMKMSEINRGLIFDDPVNSLDHERREIIAERLTEEATTKQVVVFTHDLFFMFGLKYHAAAKNITFSSTSLYKIGDTVGLTKSSIPWIAANVLERCGHLKSELQRLTKLAKTADPDSFRLEVKTWSLQLREAWERCIEERLFKGVVQRFSFGVESQRLKNVVVSKELIDEITEGMTQSSKWVHDQAPGVNTSTPTPTDMDSWITRFETFIKTKCKG